MARFAKNVLLTTVSIATILLATVFFYPKIFGPTGEIVAQNIRQAIINNPILQFIGLSDVCRFPILYSIDRIDPNFSVNKTELENIIGKAAAEWAKASGKTLFSETETGPLKINLVYDERQKETDMLKKLGLSVDQGKDAFDSLETTYNRMKIDYMTLSANYDRLVKNFESEKTALQTTIDYWNKRGGAPKKEYEKIQTEQAMLEKNFASLETERLALNQRVKDMNQVGAILNQMAKELNIKVAEYNSGGQTVRNVFEAGLYVSDQTGQNIYVYQFENKDKLQSILAHELGHALGLEHNEDKNSIMYKLNQGQVQNITATDIEALVKECPNLGK